MNPSPIRSILAATDLSPASDEVMRAAGALASFTGAELHVLHAFDLPPTPYSDEASLLSPTFERRLDEAERALDAQIRKTVPDAVEVASRGVQIYVAHRAIVERAEAVSADVIVLGPHRRQSTAGEFLGSTADRVVRTASVPCLVVREHLNLPLHRVVVPFDLSEPSRGALDVAVGWGAALAGPLDEGCSALDLRVVHVLPALFVHDLPSGRAVVGPELHRQVEESLARSGRMSDVIVREELLWGEGASEEITGYAERERADLVVLATHGHGAVKRALLGSVASAVARRVGCSVLLVPPALWIAAPAAGEEEQAGARHPAVVVV
ncbi:MAG: universal stress protein [Longimicrobiaceae bacterium]